MNGRVIKFEGSVHAEADRLLPWYVNGTLADDQRLHVEQHLVECAQCQREAAWLRTVQEELAGDEVDNEAPSKTQHLHRRMGTRRHTWPAPSAWRRRGKQLAWLAAVQAVAIVALGVTVFHQQHTNYHTLSAPNDKGSLLVVVFDSHITEAQMRQLVRVNDARIVGGPTESGAYIVRVPDAREAAARKMLQDSGQVTLVEDLGSGGIP
ncbi:zf-HC2 domain-containing protein [Dyella sp. 2HG41-7]|uniref:anti-sigma factor family protein n=1 Tax=Dyella sp. 2HG41-7 TaxID=2883239 RepID=UPI001F431220|nr:zf-HC2 domain-containing protein [Dyella sp. 2HG41-7]